MARLKKTEEEIKAEIIEAARHLFMKYGFFKTTMEDIAKAVKKGKSTLYYYYKSKDEVFLDVINQVAKSLLFNIREKVNQISSASEKLLGYFEILIEEVKGVLDLYRLILEELKDNDYLSKNIDRLFYDKDIEFLESILVFGINRKEFLSLDMSNTKSLAELLIIINRDLISNYLLKNKRIEWEQSVRFLSSIILRGIR
ncbi:MAG TPA: TetR/AcrR family transcriptional regulator [Candidatus Kapabacteria bacterium]|nr:TetR/AcrR family transcriptional regulator [Candidatus Kapabacteria bacterium]